MRSRNRARSTKSKTEPVEWGRLVVPEEELLQPQSLRPPPDDRYQPSPDDIMGVRSGVKWAERFWKMAQAGWGAGSDAMIPVIGDAYDSFVAGYKAVEDALEMYRMGMESYDYYKAKLREFQRANPGAPVPDPNVEIYPPGELPADAYDDITTDLLPPDKGLPDYVPQNDGYVPQNDGYVPDYVPPNDGLVPEDNGYVPPAYTPGGGGGRKINYKVRYVYD